MEVVRTCGSDQTRHREPREPRGGRAGCRGGGGWEAAVAYLSFHVVFSTFNKLSGFLLDRPVRLLFPSGGSIVQQEEAFNTQAPGVNNRFDLADKLRVRLEVCLCAVCARGFTVLKMMDLV